MMTIDAAATPLCHWTITNRGTSRVEHSLSSGCAHVGGRGCVHCVCNYGSMLQVSRSTQKLLALPQVSEQNIQVEIQVLSIRQSLLHPLRSDMIIFKLPALDVVALDLMVAPKKWEIVVFKLKMYLRLARF